MYEYHPYRVEADFNSDNIIDNAWLLIDENNQNWTVIAVIERLNETPKIITLRNSKTIAHPVRKPQYAGIALVKPGVYVTVCGKGHWKCCEDEPEKLSLKNLVSLS